MSPTCSHRLDAGGIMPADTDSNTVSDVDWGGVEDKTFSDWDGTTSLVLLLSGSVTSPLVSSSELLLSSADEDESAFDVKYSSRSFNSLEDKQQWPLFRFSIFEIFDSIFLKTNIPQFY